MTDVKTVRGTVGGATVETSEENAERLGSAFQPEGSKTTSKSSSKSSK